MLLTKMLTYTVTPAMYVSKNTFSMHFSNTENGSFEFKQQRGKHHHLSILNKRKEKDGLKKTAKMRAPTPGNDLHLIFTKS